MPIDERFDSLLDAAAPAVLTTTRESGEPRTTPVWFRRLDDEIEVVIAEGDPKLKDLRREPACSLLMFETVPPFRGVEIRSDATLLEGDVGPARTAIAGRYLGGDHGARYAAERTKPGVRVRLSLADARGWDLAVTLPR